MKYLLSVCFLCIALTTMSQGLHIEENHSVLFGADTLGPGIKTMWIPSKGAFRTGAVGNVQLGVPTNSSVTWDVDDIGILSFGVGYNSTASGSFSIAMGQSAKATSGHSVAIGSGVTASNLYSLAMGYQSNATGRFSTAIGNNTTADGGNSIAFGYNTLASGHESFVAGEDTEASGERSFAFGFESVAKGQNSLAIGDSTVAMGPNSVSMGHRTLALSHSEVALGQFNTMYSSLGYGGGLWIQGDRLFVIGNGTSKHQRSDAIVVLKNGKTGIGTSNPSVLLEVTGVGDDLGGVLDDEEVSGYFKNELDATHSAISIDANEGRDAIIYLAEDSSAIWDIRHDKSANSEFNIRYQGGTGINNTKLKLDIAGNLTIDGTYNPSSDINRKHNIFPINEDAVLDKISKLPISSWSYKEEGIRHIGPMAQDFYAAFELGQGETTIATVDADGVALAAIKALNKKIEEQERKFEEQSELIKELQLKIISLEK